MKIIRQFSEISNEDVAIVGGKGASLGEMANLDLPVPSGFCITAQSYEKFVEPIQNQIMDMVKIDVEDTAKLEKTAKDIQDLIIDQEIPQEIISSIIEAYKKLGDGNEFVAVRSSATAEDLPEASFAGQQSTFLNIKGDSDIVEATRKCWASLFTARAIYYRIKNKFKHEDVLIAVVIQKMVNSKKAGVLFTVNPVTNDPQEMIIEGAFGLGELVVSGQITPDSYITDKEGNIKEKNISNQNFGLFRNEKGENEEIKLDDGAKECLTPDEVKRLAVIGKEIENHYKKPQDIEWAVDQDDKIFITQSRPVTTFK